MRNEQKPFALSVFLQCYQPGSTRRHAARFYFQLTQSEPGIVLKVEPVGFRRFRQRQRFFAELFSRSFIRPRTRRQHFERDIAVQLLIVRAIHHAYASRANALNDSIVAENVADEFGDGSMN